LQRSNTGWIQTFTGKQFYPLDIREDDIDIVDIAHSLSMQCRYSGHSEKFYCPTPDQRILTANLEWIPAGDIKLGQELIAFDENPIEPGSTGKLRRKHRYAVVTHVQPTKREVIRLIMEDGSEVKASNEHPWLVATKISKNQKWQTCAEIKRAVDCGRARYMHKFYDPWTSLKSRESGWLAGIYDGEGYLSFANRRGIQMGISQNPGLVLDEMRHVMNLFSFPFSECKTGKNKVISLQSIGGFRAIYSTLGQLRPIRLIEKFKQGLREGFLDKQLDGKSFPLKIVSAESIGEEWVSGIETSSHTYFCEGFGAHNSVAEHSYHVSKLVPEKYALCGLLHDASEAYLSDIPRPLKPLLPEYKKWEENLEEVISLKYNVPFPLPTEVKEVDNRILKNEYELLMKKTHEWVFYGEKLDDFDIYLWQPEEAKYHFLRRFMDLMQ
jgi:5'-deoxynucleotidase YfbR-like HD superfamily hydrolase